VKYTAWGKDGVPDTLVEGDGPPAFVDGSLMDEDARLVLEIYAADWQNACQIYHNYLGWAPYAPPAE